MLLKSIAMDNKPTDEVIFNFLNKFKIYKDGRIERLEGEEFVPPSPDSDAGVRSKDVVISPKTGLCGRLFLPETTGKLSFLLYIHGGAFCICTPFSPVYNNYVASLAERANVVALSIHYRRATEHLLPTAYDDAGEALRWAASHSGGDGPEEWLNRHADFQRAFVVGDSAGGTLTHSVVLRAGLDRVNGLRIMGMVLFNPYFTNDDEPDRLLEIIFPTSSGPNDPRVNPGADPKLGSLGCGKVLIFVAELDFLRDRGWNYYKALKKIGWPQPGGSLEIMETEGEDHVFHLYDPDCEKALAIMDKTVSFLKHA